MRVFVAGHHGMVGSAVVRFLKTKSIEALTASRSELDLTNQESVDNFFKFNKPDYIVMAAAKVGGIVANSTYPADFIKNNLLIQTNTIDAANKYGCKRFCFLGSSCIYPKMCPQPIKEEYLLTGPLEETNYAYATAKIAGVQMMKAYRSQYNFPGYSLMPTNLYGINDNFDLKTSHALPALIRKFHEAKINNNEYVTVWGNNGVARREFLFVDDLAEIIVNSLLGDKHPDELMNVGVGEDVSIHELSLIIKDIVGFNGEIKYDTSKPDGTPRKLLDVSKMRQAGFNPQTPLRDGIKTTYEWFKSNI